MKKGLAVFTTSIILLGIASLAQATLTTIGNALYDSDGDSVDETYNLIWDDNNNGNSIVWLDYSNSADAWSVQDNWTTGIGSDLTIYLKPNYSVSWDEANWRLPNAGNPQPAYDQHTFDSTTTELGHLYYIELGLQSYTDRGNQFVTEGELNALNFDNLIPSYYWFGNFFAVSPVNTWEFDMASGGFGFDDKDDSNYGIAVRNAQITVSDSDGSPPIPEPTTMLLFGTGIIGLAGFSRKKLSRKS